MYTHGIKVFDGTDNDAVVIFVTDHFGLVLFPANQRLVDQQLIGRRQFHATGTDFNKFFLVIGDTAATATHGE